MQSLENGSPPLSFWVTIQWEAHVSSVVVLAIGLILRLVSEPFFFKGFGLVLNQPIFLCSLASASNKEDSVFYLKTSQNYNCGDITGSLGRQESPKKRIVLCEVDGKYENDC